jgi:hypothetical protein
MTNCGLRGKRRMYESLATSSNESRFSFVTAPSAWLKCAGYADAGWRRQLMECADLGLKCLENTMIYLRRLSQQEACLTLA